MTETALRQGSETSGPASPVRRRPAFAPPSVVRSVPPAVLLVLGLIQLLRDRPLWYDEAYSKLVAGVSFSTLVHGVVHRVGVVSYLMDVPPSFNAPFYAFLQLWVDVAGSSPFALRLQSLLAAAAAVGVVAELVRRQSGWGAGLVAGLLLATGPLLLDEATQARSYGVALLALALTALALQTWFDTGRALWRVGIAAALAGLLHWFTLPVLVAFGVAALARRGRSGGRAALVLAAACLPTAVLVAWSFSGGTQGAPSPVAVGAWLPVVAVGDWSAGLPLLSVILAVAAVVGVVRARDRALLVCWIVVPLVLITAVEILRPSYYPRYLLFTLFGLVAAAGIGLATLPWRRLRVGLATAVVGLSLVATVPQLSYGAREPSPAVVTFLAGHQQTGQPIVPADGRTSLDLETYIDLAPRLEQDLVLPPTLFTDQTTSSTVWLVRVKLKSNSLPVVPTEQRLIDAGWTRRESTLIVGSTTDLQVQRWTR